MASKNKNWLKTKYFMHNKMFILKKKLFVAIGNCFVSKTIVLNAIVKSINCIICNI